MEYCRQCFRKGIGIMKIKKVAFSNLQILIIVSLIVIFCVCIKYSLSLIPYIFFAVGGEMMIILLTIIDSFKNKRKRE